MNESAKRRPHKPEIMSPAGHWPELNAAVAAGADAVYFGLQHFTARAKVGFSIEDLPAVIRTLHRHAVKGFVTFNTLVFEHELNQARSAIVAIAESGADAIIVQDIGVATLARQVAPGLDIHGSTQMSITSAEGAQLAASLGCSRVVLGRELSIKDIRKIASTTDVELEVFVHGALCVSYSGQCYSSEAWGGRSANRGQCAQACRLSYDLMVDGQRQELGEFRYLLSPGDLYALEQVPELTETGIACFKIEGRYKGPEYVALTTRAYRNAIDAYCDNLATNPEVTKKELEQVYSRGLGPHFVSGINHQSVVVGRAPRHRGLRIGTVSQVEKSAIVVSGTDEIRPGDGLVFDSATWRSPDEKEEGGHVYETEDVEPGLQRIRFGHGHIDFKRIRNGDWVWRTHDPNLNKKANGLLSQSPKTTPLRFSVEAQFDEPLRIVAHSETGESVVYQSDQRLARATRQALDHEQLVRQLGRLGGTPFHLQTLKFESEKPVFCPVSWLNQARRSLVQQLVQIREAVDVAMLPSQVWDDRSVTSVTADKEIQPQLHLLVRNSEQLEAAIACQPASITLDYLELYGLRPSVEKIKQANIEPRVASPRILKPSEQKIVRFLLSLGCSLLIRSGGLLYDLVNNEKFKHVLPELHGDFSLNATNSVSVQSYLEMGLGRITAAYDLNRDQIVEIRKRQAPGALEVVGFQHLPVFHTEHCVFCRFLSDGTDNTNCGHPCEKHQIRLRDNQGREHAVLADVGCRNTVFNAEAQFNASAIALFLAKGVQHLRIEFVHQTAKEVQAITNAFTEFMKGTLATTEFEKRVSSQCSHGTTVGSLFVPKDFKQLVQLS